jgi:hypothetical protein
MLLQVLKFAGIAPAVSERLLQPNMAVEASNCYFLNGVVGPWKAPKFIVTPAKAGVKKSIYKMGQQLPLSAPDYEEKYWLHWTEDVDVVKGQVADSSDESTFFTGETFSGKTTFDLAVQGTTGEYPETSYPLGVASPTNSLAATIQSGDGSGTAEDRYYVYTYVNTFGVAQEESAPSPANLVALEIKPGQVARVTGFVPPPSSDGNITHWRLYRTATGSQAADFQFVTEQPVGTSFYDDSVLNEALGEVLPSYDWNVPPTTLRGLVNLPNGITAGFTGNDLYFSEPYRPFTFPVKYSLTLDYKIVGQGVFGASLVVLTQGNPYVISGIDPEAMSSQKLEDLQACVSKRSVVSMGFGVMYASPDGLILVNGNGVKNVTEALYDRRAWQALNPSTITACNYEGRYMFWTATQGFIFDPVSGMSKTSVYATATHNDVRNDALYLQIGNDIRKWDGDTEALTFTWKSKVFEIPKLVNFAWAQVNIESGSVTLKVYAEGVLRSTHTVTSDVPFRLQSGFKGKYWQIELSGTGSVRSVNLAQTIEELRSV